MAQLIIDLLVNRFHIEEFFYDTSTDSDDSDSER